MEDKQRPNLLYIHSDQHSPFVTGCYGDPLVQTPHLDRLARDGTLFENAYCPSPICVPSRMSMLTGRYPYQNEVWTNQHALDPSVPTLVHAMGAAGYRPVIIGRMHALGPDQLHGYVERLVGDHSSNYIGGKPVDRGSLSGTAGPDWISLELSGAGQSAYQVHDEYVCAAAVDTLNRLGVQKRSGQRARPFNVTAGFMLPHPPYVARKDDLGLYWAKMTMPRKTGLDPDRMHPHLRWWRQQTGIEQVSKEASLRARAAYWGLVTRLDAMIGQILSALEENGLADDTLIVYTSDHGDMLGEHGLWWKHTFYEESAKVPLLMSWPGRILPGQRCSHVVSAVDVTATMVDALGAPALPNACGKSFLGLITHNGNTVDWEDLAFSEYCTDEYCPEGGCYQRMIRLGAWKLNYYHGQEPQLFDLHDDPGEQVDRARDPACREIREELTRRVLDGWDPKAIKSRMTAKRADNQLLCAWAKRTQPMEHHRWSLRPEMNYLE